MTHRPALPGSTHRCASPYVTRLARLGFSPNCAPSPLSLPSRWLRVSLLALAMAGLSAPARVASAAKWAESCDGTVAAFGAGDGSGCADRLVPKATPPPLTALTAASPTRKA